MQRSIAAAIAAIRGGARSLAKRSDTPDFTVTGGMKRRERASGGHRLHKQAIGNGWRRKVGGKIRWRGPHQSKQECARRVRQMARDAA